MGAYSVDFPQMPFRQLDIQHRTGAGVYAFGGLPGLRDVEYPTGERASEGSPPNTRPFTILVEDRRGRFLPMVFGVDLPLNDKGIFLKGRFATPENSPPGFYLFSAPTRSASAGLAAVRATLVDATTQQAAAYAVLEVQTGERKWYGISDARGATAVLFPYPTFSSAIDSSPPEALQPQALLQQQWDLTIGVRYAPDALIFPLDQNTPPDLKSIFSQPPGDIWPDQPLSPPNQLRRDTLQAELQFGREVILRTNGLSELWIAPDGLEP